MNGHHQKWIGHGRKHVVLAVPCAVCFCIVYVCVHVRVYACVHGGKGHDRDCSITVVSRSLYPPSQMCHEVKRPCTCVIHVVYSMIDVVDVQIC